MKKARIIIPLVLAIKNYFKKSIMAKKTTKETTDETVDTTVEETTTTETAPAQTGHPSRDFHTPLTQEDNG